MQRWQLRQRFFGRGQHLLKFPAWKQVYPAYGGFGPKGPPVFPVHEYFGHSDVNMSVPPFGYPHVEIREQTCRAGNLDNAQYQYFLGHPIGTSDFAQCRVCLALVGHKERGEHSKEHGCFKTMCMIVKELATDECVVCLKWTAKSRWGLPLCSVTCQELWKFEVVQPALILAGVAKHLSMKGSCAKD
jgi:hypothetical protein